MIERDAVSHFGVREVGHGEAGSRRQRAIAAFVGFAMGLAALTSCGGGSGVSSARTTVVTTTVSTTIGPADSGGAGPSPTSADAKSGPSPDPCAIADAGAVQTILGAPPGPPKPTHEMSADGTGLVLNCVFLDKSDQTREVDFVQRLNSGRASFEKNRAAAAARAVGGVVPVGADGYWDVAPSGPQLLALDGNDLVAVLFRGLTVDLGVAKPLMDHALAVRHAATPTATAH